MMQPVRHTISINRLLLQSIFLRLFLPLSLLGVGAVMVQAYFSMGSLYSRQYQVTSTLAQLVQYHLQQGSRTLDSLAHNLALHPKDQHQTQALIENTRDAFGYFDTLYVLDNLDRVIATYPDTTNYRGLDFSTLPDVRDNNGLKITLSRPYISVRTGEPTVLMIQRIPGAGRIVGEFKLGILGEEIRHIQGKTPSNQLFIADQHGTLLGHSQNELVQQQSNIYTLPLLHQTDDDDTSHIYQYEGHYLLGTSSRIVLTGGSVFDPVRLGNLVTHFIWILVAIALLSFALWAMLWRGLRAQLRRQVILPLRSLGFKTQRLLDSEPSAQVEPGLDTHSFSELERLSDDFDQMQEKLHTHERALRQSEERFRSLFNQIPIGLFRFDLGGHFLDTNPALAQILGYPDKEALLQLNIQDLLFRTGVRPTLKELIPPNQEIIQDWEIHCYRHDGRRIYALINARLQPSLHGESSYSGSLQDISERKLASLALRRSHIDLENKVRQRTTELTEKNLELGKAYQKLQDAQLQLIQQGKTAAIGQLAAGMANEINNPLAFVSGNLEILRFWQKNLLRYIDCQEQALLPLLGQESGMDQAVLAGLAECRKSCSIDNISKEGAQVFNESLEGTRRISTIIKNLLAFAQDSSSMDVTDITMALDGAVVNIQSTADSSIQISKDIEPLPPIACQIGQLYQVFLHIIRNAVQAIGKEPGSIHISTRHDVDNLYVCICDSGHGMSEEVKKHLFEPFFTTRSAEGGTGLGLSIAQDIVRRHHGRIDVESSTSTGTCISICLPLAIPSEAAGETPSTPLIPN